jgi:hypothetical protein
MVAHATGGEVPEVDMGGAGAVGKEKAAAAAIAGSAAAAAAAARGVKDSDLPASTLEKLRPMAGLYTLNPVDP